MRQTKIFLTFDDSFKFSAQDLSESLLIIKIGHNATELCTSENRLVIRLSKTLFNHHFLTYLYLQHCILINVGAALSTNESVAHNNAISAVATTNSSTVTYQGMSDKSFLNRPMSIIKKTVDKRLLTIQAGDLIVTHKVGNLNHDVVYSYVKSVQDNPPSVNTVGCLMIGKHQFIKVFRQCEGDSFLYKVSQGIWTHQKKSGSSQVSWRREHW